MAEFIVGNSIRKLAREHRFLRRFLWRLDYTLIWLLIKAFTLIPIDRASRLGDGVGRWVGGRLKRKSAIYKENLAIAFPEMSDDELEQLVRRSWGRVGRILWRGGRIVAAHLRANPTRAHGVDLDVVVLVLFGQDLGLRVQRRLAAAVGHRVAAHLLERPQLAGQVDDAPVVGE